MSKQFEIPLIPVEEATPLVKRLVGLIEILLEENRLLKETVQQMRDEIAVLKGEKGKPKFKASRLDKDAGNKPSDRDDEENKKRPGSNKRAKTAQLPIHNEQIIKCAGDIPDGSRFKGYREWVVQDIRITAYNTKYRLECWQTPTGEMLVGELPEALGHRHFGPELRAYIIYQHHHCHVTQPLLWEQLQEWGVDISVGQIDAILTSKQDNFVAEKDSLLSTALEVTDAITVDDSGARHQGKNGYVTHIGNEYFAWFASTGSKSRINFLHLLHAGPVGYLISEDGINYMQEQGLAQKPLVRLQSHPLTEIPDPASWKHHLDNLGITSERHRQIATEGALIGNLLAKGFRHDLAIISDGAGQFAIFLHGLCWVHSERLVHKLIPLNEAHRQDIVRVRGEIWDFYADLKAYQIQPEPNRIAEFENRFDKIFTQRTSFETLNKTLKRTYGHKDELLLVLRRPEIPLHTNGSETDIRDYVKKRKVSGGTRSDQGKQCRDTFASLKKTCRKLGISFWAYLTDRLSLKNEIPLLPTIIRQRVLATEPVP